MTIYCATCGRSQALVEYGFRLGAHPGTSVVVVERVVRLAAHCGCPREPLRDASVRVLAEEFDPEVWRDAGLWWRLPAEAVA